MAQQTKLTMVSLVLHGTRYTKFVELAPDTDGKLRVEEKNLPWPGRSVPKGMTYRPGA